MQCNSSLMEAARNVSEQETERGGGAAKHGRDGDEMGTRWDAWRGCLGVYDP